MWATVRRIVETTRASFGSSCPEHEGGDEGFTIIEVVMASALLLTVLTAVMSTVSYATTGSMQSQKRQGALNLATLRIEQAHALPYASVGTTMGALLTGSPSGTIPAVETTAGYTITTTVRYAIDPQTHKSSYKIVRADVTWATPISGTVSVESAVIGGETLTGAQVLLSVVDLDDASIEIPGALITLDPYGTTTNQAVTTDNDGKAMFATVSTGTATFTAVKANYMADMKPFAGKVVNPGLNEWTLSMQRASSATVHTQAPDGASISGATVSLTCTDTSHYAAAFTTTKTIDETGNRLYPNLWEIKNAGFSYLVKLVVPGWVGGSMMTTTFPMESGGLDKVITMTVPTTTWLELRVVDVTGWDVEGATVTYTNPDGSAGTTSSMTDVNGRAWFFGLASGQRYTFTANKTYSSAPILRTGSQSKTISDGYNFNYITTVRQ